jgi:Uncharacterised ACR, YagE family COG1723
LLARYAFSQALARSTALSALEISLDRYLSSVALLPHSLSKTGKPGLGRKALIKKLGELMKFRQGLNLNRENFSDTPDFYWAEPELEGGYSFASLQECAHRIISLLQLVERCTGSQGSCYVPERQNHICCRGTFLRCITLPSSLIRNSGAISAAPVAYRGSSRYLRARPVLIVW